MKKVIIILLAVMFLLPYPLQCLAKGKEKASSVYSPEDMIELTVVKKDYLIKICNKYLEYPKRWREIAKINNLKNPHLIYPKEKLNIPIELLKGTPLDGKVTFIKGDAQKHDGGKGVWAPLKLGDTVRQKSFVKTSAESALEVTFDDGSSFFLRPNTELGLTTVQKKVTSHLVRDVYVETGRVLTKVREATGAGSRLKIKTPSSTAAVRGTEFRVAVDQDKKAFTEVLDGNVAVDAMQKKIALKREEGTMAKKGEPPIDPKKLLPPPAPVDIKPQYNPPVRFDFSMVEGALSYRVMIAKDKEGKDMFHEQAIKSGESIDINNIPEGSYYLSAQSIDNIGLEGIPSEPYSFSVKKEEPPKPYRASILRKIQYGHYEVSVHPQNSGAHAFANYIREHSRGEITVEIFPWGQLGSERSMANQVKNGALYITAVSAGVLGDFIPELNILELPFIYPDRIVAHKVLDDKEVRDRIVKLCDAKGFTFIGYAYAELRDITNSRRPVKTPDDLRGMKIRTIQGPVFIDTFRILGANPTYLPAREVYNALKQGMIDGQDNSLSVSMLLKYTEVNKYATLLNHILTVRLVVVNKKYWETLSPEQQKIFMEAADIQTKVNREESAKNMTGAMVKAKDQLLEITGLTSAERDAFKKMVKPVLDKYRGICGPEWYDFYIKKIDSYSGKK
jgi:tripartite ATP-independent transporter DctP family solute receptor